MATILTTERLQLRELTPADAPALLRTWGDAENMRVFPRRYDLAAMEGLIARSAASYQEHGHGLWAVVRRDTGELIGDAGLVYQEILGATELELGYHLERAHQGLGFATEAARACLAWGFAHTRAPRIVSMVAEANAASLRVATRVHAGCLGSMGLRAGLPHVWYGTDRPDLPEA